MGPLRTLIALAAPALLFASGCAGKGWWKSKDTWTVPEMTSPTPASGPGANKSGVVQAGGVSPFATMPAAMSWLTGKSDKLSKAGNVVLVIPGWRNKVEKLPDPVRQGALGQGLAGQIWLFDGRDLPAIADGTITVELHDETPRSDGRPPNKPERWQFKKDVLAAMRDTDERFGPCYVLFLPWPTYRPDVTHVRIAVRYDPERGYPIMGEETSIILDTSTSGARGASSLGSKVPFGIRPPITIQPGDVLPDGKVYQPGETPPTPSGPGPGMGAIRMGGPLKPKVLGSEGTPPTVQPR